ncbi:MAG: glycine cleavage system protein GcvH [Hyphomicrobiaceae bacterium]|nr:glycine cleavage system protein GcvH [Hyphomicrobiaceae bacterium]
MLRFSKDHEWIRVDGSIGTVGISHHAQAALGDVVFVELPEVGKSVEQGGEAAVVESVKAASEVYCPVAGTVTEVNEALPDNPALVNEDPEAGAWFFKLEIADKAQLDGLMDEAAYKAYLETIA